MTAAKGYAGRYYDSDGKPRKDICAQCSDEPAVEGDILGIRCRRFFDEDFEVGDETARAKRIRNEKAMSTLPKKDGDK